MMNQKLKKLIKLIESIEYGSIKINKQAGKIVNVKKEESIKLNN